MLASARWRAALLAVLILLAGYSVHCAARNTVATVNSDSLYLTAFLRDVLGRGVPFSSWHVQPAPAFFPDAPVFGALLWILRGPVLASYVYATLTLWLLGAGTARLARETGASRRRALVAGLLATLVLALLGRYERQFTNVLFPAHHGSGVVVGLFLAAETLRLVRLGSWRRFLLMALVAALTVAFDGAALIHGVGPALAALLAGALAGSPRAGGGLVALGVLSAAAPPFGRWCASRLAVQVVYPAPHPSLEWSRLVTLLSLFPGRASYLPAMRAAASFWIFTLASSLVLLGLALSRRRSRVRGAMLFALAAACTLGILMSVAATGLVVHVRNVRYLLSGWVYPACFFSVALVSLRRNLVMPFALGLAASVSLAILSVPPPTAGLPLEDEPLALRPAPVVCAASFLRQHDATRGFASYWAARQVSELAEPPLSLVPIYANGTPYAWLASDQTLAWSPAPNERFAVVALRVDLAAFAARYREVARTSCPELEDVVIFENRPPSPNEVP